MSGLGEQPAKPAVSRRALHGDDIAVFTGNAVQADARIVGGVHVRTSNRRLMKAFASIGVLAVVAACGPGKPPTDTTSTPAASASPAASVSPSPLPGAGAATALDAYREMWKAYVAAIKIPDPSYPDLLKYAQGDALKVFTDGLTAVKNNGLVGRGDVTINPSVTAAAPNATPPTVDIQDCVDTSTTRLQKADGSPYQDNAGGKRAVTAKAAQQADGSWKVTAVAVHEVRSC